MMLKLNEYRLIHEEGHLTLNSGLENLSFEREPVKDALKVIDRLEFTYFQPLPSPIGITESVPEENLVSVFVPVDRLRLKMLDNLFFYPVVFYSIFLAIQQIMAYPFIKVEDATVNIVDWYIKIWPFIVDIGVGNIPDTFFNAFILWTIVATSVVLVAIFILYWTVKFFISWTPSMLINLTFGLYLEG